MTRTFWLAATTALTLTATIADAQRVVAHGPSMHMGGVPRGGMPHPGPKPGPMPHPQPPQHWQHQGQWQHQSQRQRTSVHINIRNRWGGRIGGKWWGGGRAPGGWHAYRRPFRGFVLPSYWISPNWYIPNWGDYGLSQPPYGYNWSRYYDDAVLVDGRGSVYDTRGDVDWDGGAYGDDRDYADGGSPDDGYVDEAYGDGGPDGGYDAPPPPPGPGASYPYPGGPRHDGAGGAVAGAVIGGVAGGAIAGRGHRVGGALIGAGVGAAAGYAIDRAEDRRPLASTGAGYPPPPPGPGYAPPPPPPPGAGRPVVVHQGGYYANGYYYPGPTVTTVTVTSTPVVTTTTEVFEDTVTYRRPARKVWHKKVWRAKPRCICK